MIFIGYAKNHARDCYHMYNPNTGNVKEMRDIMWLNCIYNGMPEFIDEVTVHPQLTLPFKPEDAEAREGVMMNASEPKVKSKDDKKEWSTVHTRLGKVVKPPILYMNEYGTNRVEGALSTTPKQLSSIVQAR